MSLDVLSLILQAGSIVKAVLLVLAVSSIASWAIILAKWLELRSAAQDSEAFIEVYQKESLESSFEAARQLDRSPLAVIFLACCGELNRLGKAAGQASVHGLDASQRRALVKVIRWSAGRERLRLERGLPFLATVGSSAPFVGLFGTVIGIITTFQGIGRAASASLAVVGPGMAEALIATAVGLLAAIPASMAYNAFSARIDGIAGWIALYETELETDLEHMNPEAGWASARVMGE